MVECNGKEKADAKYNKKKWVLFCMYAKSWFSNAKYDKQKFVLIF